MLGTGSHAAQDIHAPGFAGGASNHARGHLLGRQLGGSGTEERNLVTLFHLPANTPVMPGFENQVAAVVRGGQTIDDLAVPIYQGVSLIPIGVTIQARGSGGYALVSPAEPSHPDSHVHVLLRRYLDQQGLFQSHGTRRNPVTGFTFVRSGL